MTHVLLDLRVHAKTFSVNPPTFLLCLVHYVFGADYYPESCL